MSEFDSSIPGPSDRPDVPEFWRLSEIVLSHDADSDGENGLRIVTERYLPIEVVEYMAFQRNARGLLTLAGIPEAAMPLLPFVSISAMDALAGSCAGWIDGFCAGAAYERKYGKVSE